MFEKIIEGHTFSTSITNNGTIIGTTKGIGNQSTDFKIKLTDC